MDQPCDLGEAHSWWTLAAGNGSRPAAEAVKAIEPMLEVKDVVRSRQKLGELRQMSVLSPQANRKLTSKQAGDKLREAAALGDFETATIMLTQGADADSSDEDGRTALIEAAWRGYANIIATLIQQGASLGQSDASGKSPLAWAAINGHVAVSRLLLDAGQNPDIPDDEGITPLMRAAWNDPAGRRPAPARERRESKPTRQEGHDGPRLCHPRRRSAGACAAARRDPVMARLATLRPPMLRWRPLSIPPSTMPRPE
jgi:hypothetical protein